MTVNDLLAQLRNLQQDGRGQNPIFLHNQTNVPVPHVERITTHHSPRYGHVVIQAEVQYRD